jgi:hypothetical protein
VRLRIGDIPLDPAFDPTPPAWTRLREPSVAVLISLAMVLAMLLVLLLGGLWLGAIRPRLPDSASVNLDLRVAAVAILAICVLLLAHELLHALALVGASDGHTVLGFWPSRFLFYAQRLGEVGRIRSVVVGLAPFAVLSLAPFALAPLFPKAVGWLALLSVANGAGSAADLIGVALIILGTPRGAVIRNQGYETWWRPDRQAHRPEARP